MGACSRGAFTFPSKRGVFIADLHEWAARDLRVAPCSRPGTCKQQVGLLHRLHQSFSGKTYERQRYSPEILSSLTPKELNWVGEQLRVAHRAGRSADAAGGVPAAAAGGVPRRLLPCAPHRRHHSQGAPPEKPCDLNPPQSRLRHLCPPCAHTGQLYSQAACLFVIKGDFSAPSATKQDAHRGVLYSTARKTLTLRQDVLCGCTPQWRDDVMDEVMTCAAQERDFDEFARHIRAADREDPLIFNCQLGGGRTTTGAPPPHTPSRARPHPPPPTPLVSP